MAAPRFDLQSHSTCSDPRFARFGAFELYGLEPRLEGLRPSGPA
jgi:hypothetical protein